MRLGRRVNVQSTAALALPRSFVFIVLVGESMEEMRWLPTWRFLNHTALPPLPQRVIGQDQRGHRLDHRHGAR